MSSNIFQSRIWKGSVVHEKTYHKLHAIERIQYVKKHVFNNTLQPIVYKEENIKLISKTCIKYTKIQKNIKNSTKQKQQTILYKGKVLTQHMYNTLSENK